MISIHDNFIGPYGEVEDKVVTKEELGDLLPYGNMSLNDLCKKEKNLLIFPNELRETEDRIGEEPVFGYIPVKGEDDAALSSYQLRTGNIMGFIGKGKSQMRIYSRFDTEDNDYFLHYMLQRVLSINLFDMNHTSKDEAVFDLLMFMFPHYLKAALRQGIYRKYREFRRNDANIRGTIDVGRHINLNIPFRGNVAYNTREYSADNSMTQLIRHTIEYIRTRKFGDAVMHMDEETAENIATVCSCTPTYNRVQRQQVIQTNLRVASHPYYQEYIPLQLLCLRILRIEEVKYSESEDSLTGLLFDGAWLWEEYCYTVLKEIGFKHAENKKHQGAIYVFNDNRANRYIDLYKDDFVIDAKYKRYENIVDHPAGAGREDLHQLITYMYLTRSTHGAFLSPFKQRKVVDAKGLNGYGGSISLLGLAIPYGCLNYKAFCDKMHEEEKYLKDMIRNMEV